MPENLVESILFGHEKGSFTGATDKHTGKFQEADGGTLFLDEVGELPPATQVKLLRALQEGEVEPVGGRKPIKVDVRIISATNRDLIADVKAGRFREDLFYRLNVFPISVPPLRERREDIPELARHFLARFSAEEGKRVHGIGADALALLMAYRWPGNVRQLENAVFRAVVLTDGEQIGANEFPQIAAQLGPDAIAVQPMIDFRAGDRRHLAGRARGRQCGTVNHAHAAPDRRARRGAAARRDRTRSDPLCHRALPRADVGGGAPLENWAIDALP